MSSPILTLIKESFQKDEIGVEKAVEVPRDILGTFNSITRDEGLSAGRFGYNASLMFKTPVQNYNGERIAKYMGKKYLIYRTYEVDGMIELYLAEKAGING